MDFINIIGTIIDNSIEHVVTFAHMIKDLRLNKNQQDINEELYNRLEYIEAGNLEAKETYKHQLITKAMYDSLEEYDKNTLYLITDFLDNTSVFGDTFPFILGGDEEDTSPSEFGGTFPFILDGEASRFGGSFPIKLN